MSYALFILGMHHDGTRALAEGAVIAGGIGPSARPDAQDFNPEEHSETDPVFQANADILGAMGRHWSDPAPPDPVPEDARAEHEKRLAAVLDSLFPAPGLRVLADPGISLLAPLWHAAARSRGLVPVHVIALCRPEEAAGALGQRDGLSTDAALALWLRYMLEAEHATRGTVRCLVPVAHFADHPARTLEQIAQATGIAWPHAPGKIAPDLKVLAALTRHDDDTPSPGAGPLPDLAGHVHDTLAALAQSPGDPALFARLDQSRQALDARTRPGPAQDAGDPRRTLDTVGLDLQNTGKRLMETERALDRTRIDLAAARRRPWKTLGDYAQHRLLRGLSRFSPPLPSRVSQKLARSAAKRDPDRSLSRAPEAGLHSPIPLSLFSASSTLDGGIPRVADHDDVLVVTHDATRTGAPILCLNLVRSLSSRYNVTVLCLRGGDLLDDFGKSAHAVHVLDRSGTRKKISQRALSKFVGDRRFRFAIVNSIVSRRTLGPLRARGIPTVILLHEFASYTRGTNAFPDAVATADHTVFSTNLTWQNAMETANLVKSDNIHIIPQGKCLVPDGPQSDAQRRTERERLTGILRSGRNRDRFLVVGAGSVQMRKGVDLFIDTAMRFFQQSGSDDALFVWIGSGFDPKKDIAYSSYLNDQIQRADLSDRVLFLPETSEIETVYALADSLILTSRLDPLPNVAIDAMCVGVPVLCFDGTTGIADTLRDADLGATCVAGYLDTHDLAEKLVALARSEDLYRSVSDRIRAHATAAFDFDTYTDKLEALALNPGGNAPEDVETIAASQALDTGFCFGHVRKNPPEGETAIRLYLDAQRKGVNPRKPFPGFHPFVYRHHVETATGAPLAPDPLAHFLNAGKPAGPWLSRVIRAPGPGKGQQALAGETRVALHVHGFFEDALADIRTRLAGNLTAPDLFISVADDTARARAEHLFADGPCRVKAISVVPNAGRDLGPFLTGFGPDLVRDYDVIGHVHTKRSSHTDPAVIARWVELLLSGTLGGNRAGATMDRILATMAAEPHIGLVFPDDPNIMGWTRNSGWGETLNERLGLGPLPEHFNFPVGNMFWMRAEVLKPFVDLGLDWSDYPPEPLPADGTMLHALERLFGIAPLALDRALAVTCTDGLSR